MLLHVLWPELSPAAEISKNIRVRRRIDLGEEAGREGLQEGKEGGGGALRLGDAAGGRLVLAGGLEPAARHHGISGKGDQVSRYDRKP